MRVLDEHRAHLKPMVLGPVHGRLHLGDRERAARIVDEMPLDRRVHRRRAVFERDDVLRAARRRPLCPAGRAAAARSGWPSCPRARATRRACPARAAKAASSAITVGSSPAPSSPTSASAIARRIAGDGLVTVSDLRSTKPARSATPASYRPGLRCRLYGARPTVEPWQAGRCRKGPLGSRSTSPRSSLSRRGWRRQASALLLDRFGPRAVEHHHEVERNRHGDRDGSRRGEAHRGGHPRRETRRRHRRRGRHRRPGHERGAVVDRPDRRHHQLPLRPERVRRVDRRRGERGGRGGRRLRPASR